MSKISQEELLELQRRISLYEDESAYKQLFKTFYLYLVRFSEAITKDRNLAEDIVSDVFTSIWKNRSRIIEIEDLKIYLYVSVKNNSLKEVQKKQKNSFIDLSELEFASEDHFFAPESAIISKDLYHKINASVEKLPPRARLIFKLAKEDGLPYKKIAEILQISIKTIDNQLSIALKKLASDLKWIKSGKSKNS